MSYGMSSPTLYPYPLLPNCSELLADPPYTLLSPVPGPLHRLLHLPGMHFLIHCTSSPQFAQLTCTHLRHCLQEDPWILSLGWGILFPAFPALA